MTFRRLVLALTTALIISVATAAVAAETDWSMARYDEAQTGYTPQNISLPLTLSWQHNTTKLSDNTSAPAVVGKTAYFSCGDRIYAVDVTSGRLKWKYPSRETLKTTIRTGIVVWEDVVMFGCADGLLYALNATDGTYSWAFPTKGPIRSSPVVSGGTVFIGSNDNSVYAIDARTGESVWDSGFRTKDDIIASPAIAPGIVIFVSMDGNIYAANVASGRTRWNFRLPVSPVRSAPVVSGNLVFVGAGRSVYAISTKSGQMRYAIQLESDVAAPVAISGNELYVICRNKKMYSYVAGMSGYKAKWEKGVDLGLTVEAPPTIAGNMVFVGQKRGQISAFSAEDGQLLWNYTAAPAAVGNNNKRSDFTDICAPPVIADDALFVLADDGALRCFRNRAPDNSAPRVFNVTPESDVAVCGSPPITVSAILFDESTGVNVKSVDLWLDGERVEYTYDPTTLRLSYMTPITQPLRPLRDGRHNLQILATDWRGNQLDHTWTFTVDNTIPPKQPPKAKEAKKPTPRRQRPPMPEQPQIGPGGYPPGVQPPGGPDGGPPMPPGMPGMPGAPGGEPGPQPGPMPGGPPEAPPQP